MKERLNTENYRLIDTNEYKVYDEYSISKKEYIRRNPKDSDSRNNHNMFMFKINFDDTDVDVAEEVAYHIAEKVGIPCCEANLAKILRRGTTNTFDTGVRSFYNYSNRDYICTPTFWINEYLNDMGKSISQNHIFDVNLIFEALFHKMVEKEKLPYEEFLRVKQDIINMIVYDIKFGNYDRGRNNWQLVQDRSSKKIDLYPMFDNEAILGFDSVENYKTAEDVGHYNSSNRMKIIRPEDRSKGSSNYLDLYEYLLKKYPQEAILATNKANRFTFEDLEKLLDRYNNLSKERKDFVKRVFLDRDLKTKFIFRKQEKLKEEQKTP